MGELGQLGVNRITLAQQRSDSRERTRIHSEKCPICRRTAHSHAADRAQPPGRAVPRRVGRKNDNYVLPSAYGCQP